MPCSKTMALRQLLIVSPSSGGYLLPHRTDCNLAHGQCNTYSHNPLPLASCSAKPRHIASALFDHFYGLLPRTWRLSLLLYDRRSHNPTPKCAHSPGIVAIFVDALWSVHSAFFIGLVRQTYKHRTVSVSILLAQQVDIHIESPE